MFVTVVIPTLNEEDYVGILLHSLAAQSYKDFEVIVVDGGSKDATQDKVLEFQGLLTLRFVKSPEKGVAFQRNYGSSIAKSDHVMFMDADDYVDPDFLEKVVDHLEKNPKIDLLTTWIRPISNELQDHVLFYSYNQFYLDLVKKWKPISGGAFIYVKKKVFNELNGFKSDVVVGEDYDLVYRAHKAHFKFEVLKKPLVHTSVRRLEKMGRSRYLWSLGKNAVYYHFRHVFKGMKNMKLDYEMNEGGAYYKKGK